MNIGRKAVSRNTSKIELSFPSSTRPGARYVSDAAVCEEALEHGRWIGLYWSASGHVHRENVTPGLPGLDSLKRPVHAFELEIDGQSLHNRWDLAGTSRRPGKRPGTEEAVVELKHQVRPVSVKVVTRVDGFHQHTIVDVFKSAVRNRYIVSRPPNPDTRRIDVFLEPEFS